MIDWELQLTLLKVLVNAAVALGFLFGGGVVVLSIIAIFQMMLENKQKPEPVKEFTRVDVQAAYQAGFDYGLYCHGPEDEELQEHVDRTFESFIQGMNNG